MSKPIMRFNSLGHRRPDGEHVFYEDHVLIYNELVAEIEKLKAENAGKSIQISGMETEINRLKQIITEPGEGNRYRLLMNDNAKLTKQNEIANKKLKSIGFLIENSADYSKNNLVTMIGEELQ